MNCIIFILKVNLKQIRHDKKYRVSPVGFTSIALFFLDQTDVLKQTHIVIADNQVAETLWS
jgi:hypothetical protein